VDDSDNFSTLAFSRLGELSGFCLLLLFEKISHLMVEGEPALLFDERGCEVISVFVMPLVLISMGLLCTLWSTNVENSVFSPLFSIEFDNASEEEKVEGIKDDFWSFALY
jgi:hypothetical protein